MGELVALIHSKTSSELADQIEKFSRNATEKGKMRKEIGIKKIKLKEMEDREMSTNTYLEP